MRRAGRDFRLISVLSPLRLRVVGVGADLQSWSRGRDSSRSDAAGDPVYVAGSGFQVTRAMLLSIGMLMLSATQVYTILTVQLFAFLNLLPVEADILAYNFENASQTFDDLPARFGYRLPAEGLKGFLINSKPENACEPIVPPPLKDNSSGTFIVLIRRLDCNFDIKVLNAQRAGYKAAIVHNVDSDDLISMGSNDSKYRSQNLSKIDIELEEIGFVKINLRNSLYINSKKEMSMMYVPFVWMNMKMAISSEFFPVPMLITASV
uniref:Ring finger protein 13 n=1 Tax=Rhinolophus ferrumequinum TaxID=59479 RepID=A0A671ECP4_RHIFE